MRHEIILAPEALRDLRRLRPHLRCEVRDALEPHLRHEPTKVSRSRVKRLRGIARPQFRLRVGEARVYYDVSHKCVEVLAIVLKDEADDWLMKEGKKS